MEENISYYENQFIRADALISDGNVSEAKEILEEILGQYPDFGKAHNHLGWIYYTKLSNHEKGAYHYKLAMRFDPNYPAAYLNYTYLLVDLGRLEEAKEHIAETLNSLEGADKASYHSELGRIYEMEFNLIPAYEAYKKAASYGFGAQFIENMKMNMNRVKDKMTIFEKLKLKFT